MIDKEKILKHLDTMDRFPEDIDELEDDIKQGKFDPKTGVCKWNRNIDDNDQVYYITSCNESFHFLFSTLKCDPTFRYCPYCSKEIEEVKDER